MRAPLPVSQQTVGVHVKIWAASIARLPQLMGTRVGVFGRGLLC